MDAAAYYAIGRKWKKSLDILLYRASMSESHYVPASKKVKCRQTIEKGSTTGCLRPYLTVKFSIICKLTYLGAGHKLCRLKGVGESKNADFETT